MKPIKKIKRIDKYKKKNIVAIVGDTQVGLWIVRNMAENGLCVHSVVRSKSGQSAWSRYSSSSWILKSQPGTKGYFEELNEICKRVNAGSIMPVSEGNHHNLIKNRNLFEPGIHIFSPEKEIFEKATDKDYTHNLCVSLDIPVAKGTTLDELMKSKDINLSFPLVLRTRNQNIPEKQAPWKAEYAENQDELNRLYKDVESFADNIIVQEYHRGAEDHIQVLMHNKEAFMTGEYIGEHHMPLAGGVTVRRRSCFHEKIKKDAVKLLKALDYEGIAGVQFHYDEENESYIFLEINPRFIGGTPTLIMAGFDSAYLLWQSWFEPENMKKGNYKNGLKTGILGGDANWLIAMLGKDRLPPGEKRLKRINALADFLRHFMPGIKDDSFLFKDPLPFFMDFIQMAGKFGSKAYDIIESNSVKGKNL